MGRAPTPGPCPGCNPRAFSDSLRYHLDQQRWQIAPDLDRDESLAEDREDNQEEHGDDNHEEPEEEQVEDGLDYQAHLNKDCREAVGLLSASGSDAVRCSVLKHCSCSAVVSLRGTCRDFLAGTHDVFGRLLVGSAVLRTGSEASTLKSLSPKLLTHLQMPNVQCEDALSALNAMRLELETLQHLTIRFAPPRPGTTNRLSQVRSAPGMVTALASGLPHSLTSLDVDLRGGYLFVGDLMVEAFSKGIPQGLEHLRLDLSHFTSRGAQAVAAALPSSLKELQLLFRGRSLVWLSQFSNLESDDDGLEALSAALPSQLRELHVMLECSDQGASGLLSSLPKHLMELSLDLNLVVPTHRGLATTERPPQLFPEALAKVLPRQLISLCLRISNVALCLDSIKRLAGAMPQRLKDLRLDIIGHSLGDEGAKALSATMPRGLTRLALSLRGWRFTKTGVRAIVHVLPRHIRRLKLVFSGSPIGPAGVRILLMWMPMRLKRLNLSLRHCGLGMEGKQLLNPLAREWNTKHGSWVRVRDEQPVWPQDLDDRDEFEIWDG